MEDQQNKELSPQESFAITSARFFVTLMLLFFVFICSIFIVYQTGSFQNKRLQEQFNNSSAPMTPSDTPTNSDKSDTEIENGCVITGCNKEVCVSESQAEVMGITPCIYKPEFACYKDASCEKQKDGECGWTGTKELTECLAKYTSSN